MKLVKELKELSEIWKVVLEFANWKFWLPILKRLMEVSHASPAPDPTCAEDRLLVELQRRARSDTRTRRHTSGLSTLVMLFYWDVWNWQKNVYYADCHQFDLSPSTDVGSISEQNIGAPLLSPHSRLHSWHTASASAGIVPLLIHE